MSRVFITGSTDGLGLANARTLLGQGHDVVVHARSEFRASTLSDFDAAGIVIGDLSSESETRAVAAQVNAIGRMDAVIHNAGVYLTPNRAVTPEGHPQTIAVNVLAPYLLTALIAWPARLVYVTSGMHRGVRGHLDDLDWVSRRWNASQAYSESKLYVAALASAVARYWPDVFSNSVDPGWVPTKMGGPGATDDLELGHDTQSWLAVSDDAAAAVSGRYWHHRQAQQPARDVTDTAFQNRLIDKLADMTGTDLL